VRFKDIHTDGIFTLSLSLYPQAKKKPVETMAAEDLGVDLTPQNVVLEVMEPPPRKEGIMVGDVDELVDKLRNEAKVIS